MKVINVTRQQPLITNVYSSFICSPNNLKEIWLFNCPEGCQHNLRQYKIKVNQISKIILTSLTIDNISGLLGLLSSLSLISRYKTINIYSPAGLDKYILLGKKYSQTAFKYNLYFHILKTGLIINNRLYQVYAYANKTNFEFSVISKERFGKFQFIKAKHFQLIEGPLYGKLKGGNNFILPDGLILKNERFTYNNMSGIKTYYILDKYSRRDSIEISNKSKILQCFL